jgi:flavin reductase (DIM6/NTAB) family NADH-FMN oxidoreductase RutF
MHKEMGPFDHYERVMKMLGSDGLLLGAYDPTGKANIMTIGWGTLGIIWGMPIWSVLVRPSRYTYDCIEHSGAFTVNVPNDAVARAMGICGTLSGRDLDKFAECNLTAERAETVNAPIVAECPIVYECQVVADNDLLPPKIAQEITDGYYPEGDFHRVYFGKVLAARGGVS